MKALKLCLCGSLLSAAAAYAQSPQVLTQEDIQTLTEQAVKSGSSSQEQYQGQSWDTTLKYVSGTVSVKTGESEGWVNVKEETPLNSADFVKTGSDGIAELYIEDKGVFFIGRNTELEVASIAQSDISLTLKAGSLVAKVRKILSDKIKMQVRTPTAVCAIRGTEFAVEYSRLAKNTGVAVFEEGRLAVTPLDDSGNPGAEQILEKNMELSFAAGQKRFRAMPLARMIRHRGQVVSLRAVMQERARAWRRLSPEARSDMRDRAFKRHDGSKRPSAKKRATGKRRSLKSDAGRKKNPGRNISRGRR